MTEILVKVEAVQVEGRHRWDLGDIEALARSIDRDGLINAITVTPDNRLLAGERRLAAYRLLGRDKIEARVVDTLEDAAARLRIERDENTERKPMAPSELVALGKALEELERPRAAARKAAHGGTAPGRSSNTSGRATGSVQDDRGETRDVVAAAIGISTSTYRRAKAVVEAAADATLPSADRAVAQEALQDMDAGNTTVSAAYERVRQRIPARTGPRATTRINAATVQRRAISTAENALSGICHGLAQIVDLHPEITSEEAARWVDSLSESRRVITSLITRLKERTNAQST